MNVLVEIVRELGPSEATSPGQPLAVVAMAHTLEMTDGRRTGVPELVPPVVREK